MLRLRLLLTLLIASSLTPSFQAATITVDDAGADYTSIQAAINAAGDGDEADAFAAIARQLAEWLEAQG